MKTQKGFKLVKVDAQGVQFGNAWFSHESITGYSAEQLNAGTCGVTGGQYMAWLQADEPDYDEAEERELFEAYAKTVNDKVNLKIYTAAEGYIYVYGNYKDVSVQTSWLTWQACAKSRAGIQS